MTPVEACKALNENSVNAVRRLAEHMGVDPVGLSERLDLVDLFQRLDRAERWSRPATEDEVDNASKCLAHTHQWVKSALSSLRGDQ